MKFEDYKKKLAENPEFVSSKNALKVNFTIADAILNARLNKGLSQSKLAKSVGTRQANISRIEAGLGNPTLQVLKKIFQVLELELFLSTDKVHIVDISQIQCANDLINADSSETGVFDFRETNVKVTGDQTTETYQEMEIS